MKVSELWKVDRKSKLKKRAMIIIPTVVLAVALAFVTLYSQESGNFTLEVDRESRNHIQLATQKSDDGNLVNAAAVLRAPAKIDNTPLGYQSVVNHYLPKIKESSGRYDDAPFVNYSFYLRNANQAESVNVRYSIILQENINHLSKAIRILIVDEDNQKLYQEKELNEVIDLPNDSANDFKEGTNEIIVEDIYDLKAGETRRFSILVWLELGDPDVYNEDNLNGSLKFMMTFQTFAVGTAYA